MPSESGQAGSVASHESNFDRGLPTALTQRLTQRLTTQPGVINTGQFANRYTAPDSPAGRMIQRMAMPEQISSRFSTGVLQPQTFAARFNLQRVELNGASHEFAHPTSGAFAAGVSSFAPGTVQRSPLSELPQNSSALSEMGSAVTAASVQSPIAPATPQASSGSIIQRSYGWTQADAGSSLPAGMFRVSRQASPTPGTRPVSSAALAELNSGSVPPFKPESRRSDHSDLPLVKVSSPLDALQTKPESTDGSSFAGAALATSSETSIQRREDSTNLPLPVNQAGKNWVDRSPEPAAFGSYSSEPAVSVRSTDAISTSATETSPVIRTRLSSPMPFVQRSPMQFPFTGETMQRSSPDPASDQTLAPFSNSPALSPPTLIWRKSFGSESALSTPTPLTSTPSDGLISRQETTDSPIVSAANPPNAPPNANSPNQGINVAELAEQVSRIISRRLSIERERRGLGR